MRVEKTTEVILSHEELCEAVREWINLHCMSADVCLTNENVEFLADDLTPFTYDITARATERT